MFVRSKKESVSYIEKKNRLSVLMYFFFFWNFYQEEENKNKKEKFCFGAKKQCFLFRDEDIGKFNDVFNLYFFVMEDKRINSCFLVGEQLFLDLDKVNLKYEGYRINVMIFLWFQRSCIQLWYVFFVGEFCR